MKKQAATLLALMSTALFNVNAQTNCVKISEIQIKPGSNNNFTTNINYQKKREWIELYNTSCDTVDVADWYIVTDINNDLANIVFGYSKINSWASRYTATPNDQNPGPLSLNITKIPPKGLAVILTPYWNKGFTWGVQVPDIPNNTIILTPTAMNYWGSNNASGNIPPNGLLKNDNPGDFVKLYDGDPNTGANLVDSVLWTGQNGLNVSLQLDDDGIMRWHNSGTSANIGGYDRDNNNTILARYTMGTENYSGQTAPCNYLADFSLPDSVCLGDSAHFTNLSTGGGYFNWNFGDGNYIDSSLNTSHLFQNPGTYNVTLYQYDFCYIDSITKSIVILDSVNASTSNDTTICIGETITLQASGSSSYLWSTGETTSSITVAPLASKTFWVKVSNQLCFDSLTIDVTVTPMPNVDILGTGLICNGDSIDLTANYGNEFLWNTSQTIQTIQVSPNSSTTYFVTVSDGICTVNDSFNGVVDDIPVLTVSEGVKICPGEKVEIQAFPVNYSMFSWDNGKEKQSIKVKPDSTTTYIATASNWCGSVTDELTVIVHPNPIVNAGEDQTIKLGETAQLNGSGGPSWSWSSYGSLSCSNCPNPIASPKETTQYILTVVNQYGCEAKDEVVVYVDDFHSLYVPNAFSPNGDGRNDIFKAKGINIVAYKLMVFDRWGELIFVSNNMENGWDGRINGTPAQNGVYTYRIEFEPLGKGPEYKLGSITLVK